MKRIHWLVSSLVFSISQWSRYCGHSTLWDWAVDNFPEGCESWSGWSLSNIVCSGLQVVVVGDIGGVGGAGTSGAMVAPLISTSPQGGAWWAGQIALGSAQVRGWMGGSQGLTTHYRCCAASCWPQWPWNAIVCKIGLWLKPLHVHLKIAFVKVGSCKVSGGGRVTLGNLAVDKCKWVISWPPRWGIVILISLWD